MIGKLIGAIAGSQIAKHVRGVDGKGGALLGIALPTILRRLGPAGIVAAAAGGYAYKKLRDRRAAETPSLARSSGLAEPTRTQA